jgi:hypothetical protein
MINAMNNATVAEELESLFATRGLDLAADSDVVIDEFDQWRNREDTFAVFSTQTFNLVVVAPRSR